jgi:DeoR/GlpR family transcriptional regulator of sugar metabolism
LTFQTLLSNLEKPKFNGEAQMIEQRLKTIQEHLFARGVSSIEELVTITKSSPATVRRDLSKLEEDGVIQRTHGGARLAESSNLEVAFNLRESENLEVKRAIGRAAHALLKPGSTVLMDAGTTVLQLAKAIKLEPVPLTIITNGLALAQELVNVPGVEVISLGGKLRADNLSSVGPYAEKLLEEFWCDQLFLGATAVNSEYNLATLDVGEANINRKMLERAKQSVLLVDSSKFGHNAPYRVANLERITHLITDQGLDSGWSKDLHQLGISFQTAALRPD